LAPGPLENEGVTATARRPAHTVRRPKAVQTREHDRRFRLLIESVADYGIFMLDRTGRITSWNPGAERMKGYTVEEIRGRHFSCFYTPEQQLSQKPQRELEIAARVGRFAEEGWRVRKDGSHFWASVVISAVRDNRGTLIGFSKVTRDLSDRRRVEQHLQSCRRAYAVAQGG
jgi:two-component system cell cycle sensor histidine kinase/response regulator CckA